MAEYQGMTLEQAHSKEPIKITIERDGVQSVEINWAYFKKYGIGN